jgi:hypothetical protein
MALKKYIVPNYRKIYLFLSIKYQITYKKPIPIPFDFYNTFFSLTQDIGKFEVTFLFIFVLSMFFTKKTDCLKVQ